MDTLKSFIFAIGFFSVLTNGILLAILYLDPLKKFRTSTTCLFISLSISDLLTGAAACLFAFREIANHPVIFVFFWSTTLNSFLMIFIMSCERLVVVLYPLKSKSLVTKHRIFVAIGASWLVSTVLGSLVGCLPRPDRDYVQFFCLCGILILVLILIVCYVVIIWKMKDEHKLGIESTRVRGKQIIEQDHRLTRVLFLLVMILLVTVVPYVSVTMVFAACRVFSDSQVLSKRLLAFSTFYFPVELLNFAVNPIIYAWRLPVYRRSLVYYLVKMPFISEKLDTGQVCTARGHPGNIPTQLTEEIL